MRHITHAEPKRRQDSYSTAGQYGSVGHVLPNAIVELVREARQNFVEEDIQVVEGLYWNLHNLLKRLHYYLLSMFMDGQTDENGNDKYFHNIINPRNAHASKNIDLDTKDILLTAESESGWFFSFLLRNEIRRWMDKNKFGQLLNRLSENLPKFGKVIWKKTKDKDGNIRIDEVDLRDCIFDQAANSIYPKDNPMFIQRSVMAPWEIMDKVKAGDWERNAAIACIHGANSKIDRFIKAEGSGSPSTTYSMTDTTPNIEVLEVWGFFPKTALDDLLGEESEVVMDEDQMEEREAEYVYAKIILGDLDRGSNTGEVLAASEVEIEDFAFKQCDWHRKMPGRCLPVSNTELLLDLQVRMNELVYRFFSALRIGSLHLYQTRGNTAYKNLMQDAQDGDVMETKHPIEPISTELRAFNQYQAEMQNIEAQADRICNTVEVVTGESLPTNTPFRLGAQLGVSAQKIFDKVREDCGMFITEVFMDWILPEIIDDLSEEHVLEIIGSVDELRMFDEMYRQYLLAQSVKDYVLEIGRLPTVEELEVVEQTLAEELKNTDRKVQIEKKYFTIEKIKSMRLSFDVTDERKNFLAQSETMSNLLQIIASNPAILQDPTAKTLIGSILEAKGISPISFASMVSKPEAAKAMEAAAPAAKKFADNPGDANGGLNQESVQKNLEAAAA